MALVRLLSHRPAQLRLGRIRDAEPTADGHPWQGRLAAFEARHSGTGIQSCRCPAPNAGLAPSAALREEILSQTKQDSVCLWLSYPPGGSVGGENPHKPQSPRQGRVGWGHRLGLEPQNLLSSQETRLFKGQDMPRLVPVAAHGPAGASPGVSARTELWGRGELALALPWVPRRRERPVVRPLCQL